MPKPKKKFASNRILAVTEEELGRIILDIHDGPVQYLFAALSVINQLEQQDATSLDDPHTLKKTINRVAKLIEASLHEIKSFVGTFRPPEFQRRSLLNLVEGLVLQHEEWAGSSVSLIVEDIPEQASLPVKIAIYRILQEALSNAHRHSGVTEHRVHIWCEKNKVCFEVVDHGQGFDPPPLDGEFGTEREEHIGLRGMRDRVALVDGEISLRSKKGEGTQITVKIPVYE